VAAVRPVAFASSIRDICPLLRMLPKMSDVFILFIKEKLPILFFIVFHHRRNQRIRTPIFSCEFPLSPR